MKFRKMLMLSALALVMATPVMAQTATTDDPNHPRVNEVDQRLENQQTRIDNGVQNGGIASPKRAAADEARETRITNEVNRDEAAHNGHLTKAETARVNHQLNNNGQHIHRQRHNQRPAHVNGTATTTP